MENHSTHSPWRIAAMFNPPPQDVMACTDRNLSCTELLDEHIPGERDVLLNSGMHGVITALLDQQKRLQEYLEEWGRSQKSVIAKLLADTMANDAQNRVANTGKDVGKELGGAAQQRNLTVLLSFEKAEELEAMAGHWIDRQGIFNEGRSFKITPDVMLTANVGFAERDAEREGTPCNDIATQYIASASSDFSFALSYLTSGGVQEHYELMWGGHDSLKIYHVDSKACYRIHRERPAVLKLPHPSGSVEKGSRLSLGWDKGVEKADSMMAMTSTHTSKQTNHTLRHLSKILRFKNDPPEPRSIVGRFVTGRNFEFLCILVILGNAVSIAAEADWARQNLEKEQNSVFEDVDLAFCTFYTIELLLRIFFNGVFFFRGPDWYWNIFDASLVVVAVNDQASTRFGYGADVPAGNNKVFLRVIRLCKMLKVLRMFRLMRMLRELRLITNSLRTSIKTLFWSMILIFFVIFMFGLLFLQGVTHYLKVQDDVDSLDLHHLNDNWGSVRRALVTMYVSSMNGQDWKFVADPLWEVGWGFYLLFLLYTGFYTCVIANTLTSLFVEATLIHADTDQRQVIQLELENKERYVMMLKKWYDVIDTDGSGYITSEELDSHVHLPEMVAFAAQLGIDTDELPHFFKVISDCGKRPVDLETFVVGCIKLRGVAKSMDLMDLIYSHKRAVADQEQFQKIAENDFAALRESLEQGMLKRHNCKR